MPQDQLFSLQRKGPIGISLLWNRLLLGIIPMALLILAFIWLIQTASSIWKNAIGISILISNVFLFLICILSEVSLFFYLKTEQTLLKSSLLYLSGFIGIVICCILLNLSTTESCEIYHLDIEDFIIRNSMKSYVQKFVSQYSTRYSRKIYVRSRTENYYLSISLFEGIWIIALLTHFLLTRKIEKLGSEYEDEVPLINQEEQNEKPMEEQPKNEQPQEPNQGPPIEEEVEEEKQELKNEDLMPNILNENLQGNSPRHEIEPNDVNISPEQNHQSDILHESTNNFLEEEVIYFEEEDNEEEDNL